MTWDIMQGNSKAGLSEVEASGQSSQKEVSKLQKNSGWKRLLMVYQMVAGYYQIS
jgi:hypothetical protein